MILYSICLSVSDLFHFSIIPSKFIHVSINGNSPFFAVAGYYSMVYMFHVLFIHSSVDRHLGCFHTLVTVNNTAMNTGVRVSFQISGFIFFKIYPRVKLLGHMVALVLVF